MEDCKKKFNFMHLYRNFMLILSYVVFYYKKKLYSFPYRKAVRRMPEEKKETRQKKPTGNRKSGSPAMGSVVAGVDDDGVPVEGQCGESRDRGQLADLVCLGGTEYTTP